MTPPVVVVGWIMSGITSLTEESPEPIASVADSVGGDRGWKA